MANLSVSSVLKLVPLLMVLGLVIPKGESRVPYKKAVRFQNDMGDVTLTTHCRSKKDDLGVHCLGDGNYTQWSFNNFVRTVFRCTLKWNGEARDVTVYDTPRDLNRCWLKCWWSIRPDGAYSYNENENRYEKLYPW